MTAFKGDNVTKWDAGGSGDNIISDGYIKTVEKVWMDSYTVGTTPLTTADTLTIATIPKNKKITGVEVYFTAFVPTAATINVGISGDTDKFISAGSTLANLEKTAMNNVDGFQFVTTAETDILFELSEAMTNTNATITTKVMYT